VHSILKKDIETMVDRHFSNVGRGGAKKSVLYVICTHVPDIRSLLTDIQRMIMHDHLDAAATRSKERIEWLLKLEQSPATLNTHYYFDYKNKFLAYYRSCRHNATLAEQMSDSEASPYRYVNDPAQDAISALRKLGIDAQREDLNKLLPSDPMEAALGIMASVRGYFQGTNCIPLLNGSMI